MIKLERKDCEFLTPEGMLAFLFLFPGEHQESFGNRAYKVEWIGHVPVTHQMVTAARHVANAFDPKNAERHVFGTMGRIQKLEEKPGRDPAKYPYAIGKHVIDFSKVVSFKSLKMADVDMTNPDNRRRYDVALNEAAPPVVRVVNMSNPEDINRIHELNQDRLMRGLPQYQEADFPKVRLPVTPSEIWGGCFGCVSGYFYWNPNGKPATLGIGLNGVLMTRQGERLVAQISPESMFSQYAPSDELAPPPPPPAPAAHDPWAAVR